MRITADWSALARTRWYEYISRFIFGGAMTVLAGLIAKKYGPAIGGLFLAFAVIFPASATLIEKHEKRKKQQAGGQGTLRGRKAAAPTRLEPLRGQLQQDVRLNPCRQFAHGNEHLLIAFGRPHAAKGGVEGFLLLRVGELGDQATASAQSPE